MISNDVFCNCLRSSGRTGVLASEEEDNPVFVEETYSGDYVVVFDPLDGSSNIDAGEWSRPRNKLGSRRSLPPRFCSLMICHHINIKP